MTEDDLSEKLKKRGMDMMLGAKVIAIAIFLSMFVLIVMDKIERHIVTLVCGGLVLVLVFGVCMHSLDAIFNVLNLQQIITPDFWFEQATLGREPSGINWATIFFIAGMMVMVEGMGESGFFRWLCMRIASAVHYHIIPIFLSFMLMSGILSMFIDSITVILFLSVVTIELSKLLKFNPIPMIMTEIFCANLGGSSTMCGDPPNIIIGTSLKLTFFDFIGNTGVIAGLSLVAVMLFFYLSFRKELRNAELNCQIDEASLPSPASCIHDTKEFVCSCLIFFTAVVLLITHSMTGITVASIGIGIGFITLLTSGKKAKLLLQKVDYKTLLFFVGLFVVVGGLEETGILELIAAFIKNVSGGNDNMVIMIILWVSAISSAFVDNIPFAATMVPIVKSLASSTGVGLPVLAWTLSMGTDIGGCATPIGASANVVGIAVSSKEGYPIGWGKYCKTAVPATILVLAISMICLYVRYL